MKRLWIVGLIISLFLAGCTDSQKENEISTQGEKPDKLVIYLTGDEVRSVNTKEVAYYFTAYSLGPLYPLITCYGNEGHILYDAIKQYESETGIQAELHYFHLKGDMEKQIREDQKQGSVPDVVLLDGYTYGQWDSEDSLYRLMRGNWLCDLKPFLDQDGIYDSGEYYNGVLKLGEWEKQQRLLPIQFNVSTLYTSKQDMEDMGIYIEEGMSWKEMIRQLEKACIEENGKEAISFLSYRAGIETVVMALWEASGLSPVDYENMEVTLDRETFDVIAEFYQQYLKMEYQGQWKEIVPFQSSKEPDWHLGLYDKSSMSQRHNTGAIDRTGIEEWLEQGMLYLEGGSSQQMQYHSFAGQGAFFETLYGGIQKDMEMVAIPQAKDSNCYAALVQLCGGVMEGSEYPYESYQFIRYLMDRTYFPYCSIPVNKKAAEEMLNTLSTLEYELDPLYGMFEGAEKNPNQLIVINPISEDLRSKMEQILQHTEGGNLPSFVVYMPIMEHMNRYALEMETLDAAYQNTIKDLAKCLEEFSVAGE